MTRTVARRHLLTFIGAALLVYAIAYAPLVHAGFIWDDDDYIVNNFTLRTGTGLWRIWFERGALPQYYPLVHTTFWFEYRLWGADPLGYHVVNWALHGVNSLLVFCLLRRLGIPCAGLVAFVFAIHPVHVESVAWATERKNVLSGLFYLSAWLAWTRFAAHRSLARWALAFALFVAALLSKSVTASLPAAILLIAWWRDGQIRWRDVLALLPFFAIGIASGLHTAWIEMYDLGGSGTGASGEEWSLALTERLLVVGRAFWFYPGKVLWPETLVFIYPRWQLDTSSLAQWSWPILAILLIALLFAQRRRLGRGPLAAVLFHAGTLLPALGFFNVYPFRYSFVADHFQYLASLATMVLAGTLLHRVVGGRRLWVVAGALALPLAFLTYRQVHVYRDIESLWNDTIAKNAGCWMAHNNLGGLYRKRGDFVAAVHHYERTLHIKPNHYDAKLSLGLVALQLRDHAKAEALFREVIDAAPEFGPAWASLGVLQAVRNELGDAEASWRTALRLTPGDQPARANLARLLERRGDHTAALELLDEGLRRSPHDVLFLVQSARCLLALNRPEDARAAARRALAIDPDQADARRILGN